MKLLDPKIKRRFDSYYFIIENDVEIIPSAIEGIMTLLKYWVSELEKSNISYPIYLPIDFSDQYLGVFQVLNSNNDVLNFRYGFIESVHGYEITPSNPSHINSLEVLFKEDTNKIEFEQRRMDFIDDIKSSVNKLKMQIEDETWKSNV